MYLQDAKLYRLRSARDTAKQRQQTAWQTQQSAYEAQRLPMQISKQPGMLTCPLNGPMVRELTV